ncbi:MAG: efflux transporter outer membrane subunit, partial [Planctomycetota bacterium]|jgi:NodT family efflux transporter outer membrane factor (OMF) lipoprotein
VNESWLDSDDPRVNTDAEVQVEWWKVFEDPVLDALVEEAYAQNLTLRQAAVRVMQAMAERGITVGQLFPQSQEINGSFDRTKFSENPGTPDRYQNTWGLSFDAAWELDVWGRFRRGIESADAALDASLASYDDVMVSLVAEVAATYVEFRTLQVRIDIAMDNVEIQEESLRLAESRFRNGATSELDPVQAKAVLEQTRSDVPALRIQLQQAMYQLSFLLGMPPRDMMDRLGEAGRVPFAPTEVAVGIPADLLRRRPDIRLAERQAAAQSAQIGVAVADLYPSFFLSGSLGLRSDSTGSLFDSSSWTGSFTPGFSWPILNYGRLENNVRVQDAAFQAAILQYQTTVLAAAQEVEGGVVSFLGAQEQARHLAESVVHSRRSLELSTIQYLEGSSTFTRVLDSQAQLRQVEEFLASTQGEVAQSLIATYKALGGGWEVRQGMDILPEETREEMKQRTDWGDMLDPEYVSGSDLGIARHDPSALPPAEEPAGAAEP